MRAPERPADRNLRALFSRLVPAGRRESREQYDALLGSLEELLRQNGRLLKENTRLSRSLAAQNALLEGIVERLGGQGLKGMVNHLQKDVAAILRRLFIDPEKLGYPQRLSVHRFRAASQNEEDGMLLALFDRIGTVNRRFVEIGCGANGGNSGFLAGECGWTGLMVDSNDEQVAKIRKRFSPVNVTAVSAQVTRENINELVASNGFSGEIDLLSLDIDSVDYWIWEALTACRPRVAVLEYNSLLGPDLAVTVPYEPGFERRAKGDLFYYGASLAAFDRLADRKGYRLIATEPRGVNAFFLRNDVAPDIPRCAVRGAFRVLQKHKEKVKGRSPEELIRDFKRPLVDVSK